MSTNTTVAGTRRLEWLQTQRERAADEIASLAERAAELDRDLNDSEHATCESRRTEIERYDADIAVEVELSERNARFADLAERVGPTVTRSRPFANGGAPDPGEPEVVYRSAGEYLADLFLRSREPVRAARMDSYFRAAPNQLLADNPGIVPTPIVGPVWSTISQRRPAIEAATQRPMPGGGKTFTRPKVTQDVLVGKQATEKTALASQPLKIDPITVTKDTYGGYVNLSFQDRDWTDPAILDILVADLAGVYAQTTDAAFCTAFVAAITQVVPAGTAPSGPAWLTALYNAASLVYAHQNALPTTVWMSTDAWSQIGAATDTSGRPMFPYMGGSNASGSMAPSTLVGNLGGFRGVVDAHLPAKTIIVGDDRAVEWYEQIGGQLSAVEPSILGTNIAFYGYAAACVVDPLSFAKITYT